MISNAEPFPTCSPFRKRRVEVRARRSPRFSPGPDPKSLERLFDAFYATEADGPGLGLAISRRIIEAHSGRLWATANAPHGAIFQFTLSVAEARVP
jgi:signal transduction histidine kinase